MMITISVKKINNGYYAQEYVNPTLLSVGF